MKIAKILLGFFVSFSLSYKVAAETTKPTINIQEDYFLKNITQLTFEGEKSGEGYFSPDGKEIIFQTVRDKSKFYQIYKMNVDGSNVKIISNGHGKTTCSYFSPDGKKIIYASTHLDPTSEKEEENKGKGYKWDFEKSMDIFEANPDGSNLKRLTDATGYDAEGTYSHDGKKIVFTSERDGDLELYVMDSDGKNQKRITHHKGYDGGAFFSPDDKKIVYRRFDDKGNAQIVISNADGSNEKELTNTHSINWCPSFHPDGKHIIFSSNMNDRKNFELYIMDLNGNNLRQITFNKGTDILPIFSPDGKKLLWTSTRSDNKSQIFISDFNISSFEDINKYPKRLFENLKYLASDELEGRRSGTEGADKASNYISEEFKKAGLKPVFDNSYLQSFDVTTGIKLAKNNFLKANNKNIEEKNFTPLSFSENGVIESDLVFAGYGITAPDYNYDDYKDIDVKDKIVVVLRHEPQEKDEKSIFNGNKPTQYSDLRYKAFNAKNHGAKGVILINGLVNYEPKEDDLIQVKLIGGTSSVGLPFIHAKNEVIEYLLGKGNEDLKSIQEKIDKDLKPHSFLINKNTKIALSVDLSKEIKKTNNVIGYIEGYDKNLRNEVIVVGAHYDHLGFGGEESLSDSKNPLIHNGADDNASGTTGLIEIANLLAKEKTKRTIVFTAFSGEELGLLGSAYFTNHLPFKNIISMLNIDMIGRMQEGKISIGGVKTAENFSDLVKRVNDKYNFKISYFNDGYGPSDHMSFYLKDIPVLFFFTGIHEDYHRPTDDYYKINYVGLNQVTNFVKDTLLNIDENVAKPKLVKIQPSKDNNTANLGKSSGSYIGAIPDYTSMEGGDSGGVKISGIKEDSPAEKAGLKTGDIIIKFDNIEIKNLYDYSFAIKSKKPNDKVKITVKRDNKSLVLDLIVGKK